MHKLITILIILVIITGCTSQNEEIELKTKITLPSIDQNIWEGEIIFFEGIASGGTPPYTYIWDFGKTMPQIKKKESGQVVFNYEGAYKVLFIVRDSKGNENIDSVRIIVNPKTKNAF